MERVESPIFAGISDAELSCMRSCFGMLERRFEPGDTLCDFDPQEDLLGILLEGRALVERFDAQGGRSILERLGPGSVFGQRLMFENAMGDQLCVTAAAPCRVWYLRGEKVMHMCSHSCTYHTRLIENLFSLMTAKATALSERVEILSRRSIREKLLCFFRLEAARCGTSVFRLPFTLSALADYISTDRSAMMRELKKMRQDGLVDIEGKTVKIVI